MYVFNVHMLCRELCVLLHVFYLLLFCLVHDVDTCTDLLLSFFQSFFVVVVIVLVRVHTIRNVNVPVLIFSNSF